MKNFIQNKIYPISPIFLQKYCMLFYTDIEKEGYDFLNFIIKSSNSYPKVNGGFDKIQDYKNIKVLEILKHAYNTTEFYRKTIDEHGYNISSFQNIEDLKRLCINKRRYSI